MGSPDRASKSPWAGAPPFAMPSKMAEAPLSRPLHPSGTSRSTFKPASSPARRVALRGSFGKPRGARRPVLGVAPAGAQHHGKSVLRLGIARLRGELKTPSCLLQVRRNPASSLIGPCQAGLGCAISGVGQRAIELNGLRVLAAGTQ